MLIFDGALQLWQRRREMMVECCCRVSVLCAGPAAR